MLKINYLLTVIAAFTPTLAMAANPNVLLVYCSGGWDTTMVFDNKLSAAGVAIEPGASAASGAGKIPFVDHASRPSVKQFFTDYGANAAIVNGIYVSSLDQRQATRDILGTTPPAHNRPVDWLTFYANAVSSTDDIPHVTINAPFMPGEFEPAAVNLTTASIQEYSAGSITGADALGSAGETALVTFRKNSFFGLETQAATGSRDYEKLQAINSASQLDAGIAKDIAKAIQTLGPQGTDSNFLRDGKIAIELFAQGSSHAATIQAGVDGLWDTVTNNYALQTQNYEMLFSGLHAILDYAASRKVSNLMLIVMSERGRAPQLNSQSGKNPWPYTSMLLWGYAIKGGSVTGFTDDYLRGQAINPIFGDASGDTLVLPTAANIFASLYLPLGVPVALILPDDPPLSPIVKVGS